MDKQPEPHEGLETMAFFVESFAGLVPFVGNAITATVVPALQKRHAERMRVWLDELAAEMENLKIDKQALLTDDEFFYVLTEATKAAANTAHTEKLVFLQNAILNCANVESRPQDELSLRFVKLIDEMSPAHLQLMEYFDSPRSWFDSKSPRMLPEGPIAQHELALLAMGWKKAERRRIDWLMEDLTMWRMLGMVDRDELPVSDQLVRRNITDQGRTFLSFIRDSESDLTYPSEL